MPLDHPLRSQDEEELIYMPESNVGSHHAH